MDLWLLILLFTFSVCLKYFRTLKHTSQNKEIREEEIDLPIFQSTHYPSNKVICKVPGTIPGTWYEIIIFALKSFMV